MGVRGCGTRWKRRILAGFVIVPTVNPGTGERHLAIGAMFSVFAHTKARNTRRRSNATLREIQSKWT
jgi:hypothetical protein